MAKKPQLPGANDFFKTSSQTPKEEDAPPVEKAAPEPSKSRKAAKPAAGKRGEAVAQPSEADIAAATDVDPAAAQKTAPVASPRPAAVPPTVPAQVPVSATPKLDPAYIRAAAKPAPPRAIPQPETEKVTFYIPSQMLQQLEICRVRLLTEHNIKAGRSQIVQAAVALSAHDPKLIAETLNELAQIWGEDAE